jgi:Fe2+ or Zn2+ uptake regulation protein
MTNQREIILQELQKSRQHMTADEIYGAVRKKMPRISLATVYRNLECLVESGLIARMEVSGRQMRFDFDVQGHDHVICAKCHKVENVFLKKEKEHYPSQDVVDGYMITGCRVEFVGLCPQCQQKIKAMQGDKTMGCGCAKKGLSEEQKKVLQAMADCAGSCATKDIAAATGLDAKVVSCRITDLKKKGYVDSPERCRYGITEEGRSAMKD